MLFHFVALLLATPLVYSQINYDSTHNATALTGTWSSGSKAVSTGPGFANPLNRSFNYPLNTGISYTFTADGYYEISRYRMNGNGTQPTCITGVMNWVHGMYTLQPNGSITMIPFDDDGFQQIQDPCAAVSNFIETYNDTELYQSWRIFQDPTTGYKLHLFQFDGSPLAPMFQLSTTPNMLPTQQIRNTTASHVVAKRELVRRSSAAGQHTTIMRSLMSTFGL
ncbi:hypothetical protein AX14_007605 [Amanita brunnescens Koide BX004]|nr:hypothetical protein AX14_007605 [Amanita brunnescens Koide BX004]